MQTEKLFANTLKVALEKLQNKNYLKWLFLVKAPFSKFLLCVPEVIKINLNLWQAWVLVYLLLLGI
jgi:hypothetical protein